MIAAMIICCNHNAFAKSPAGKADAVPLLKEAINHTYGWDGYEKDLDKALRLYMDAASTGDPYAEACLAECFRYGFYNTVDIDKEEAIHWYKRSADHGNAEVVAVLADMGVKYIPVKIVDTRKETPEDKKDKITVDVNQGQYKYISEDGKDGILVEFFKDYLHVIPMINDNSSEIDRQLSMAQILNPFKYKKRDGSDDETPYYEYVEAEGVVAKSVYFSSDYNTLFLSDWFLIFETDTKKYEISVACF